MNLGSEANACLSIRTEQTSTVTDEDWAPLQRAYLIPPGTTWAENQDRISLIKEYTGLSRKTLHRYQQTVYPVPAYSAVAICAALNDFSYIRLLLARFRHKLIIKPPGLTAPPKGNFFRRLCVEHHPFFDLVEKLMKDEPLSDEDQAKLEREGEEIKREIDAWVEKARQLREKAREKK